MSNVHRFCLERRYKDSEVCGCSFDIAVTLKSALNKVQSPLYAMVGCGVADRVV